MPPIDNPTAMWDPSTTALASFMHFLPSLLGAIVVLLIGWFLSGFLAQLIGAGLARVGADRASVHAGVDNFLTRAGTNWKASRIVAELIRWFVFLIFVQAAASLLAMPQLTSVINSIILFIPNVVVAMAILVAGALIAKFVAGLVRGSVSELGVASPSILGKLTYAGILTVAIMAALDQLGVAETIVQTLFIGMVGAVSLATGLAFGLGGRDVASRLTHSWYEGSRLMSERAKLRESFQPEPTNTQTNPMQQSRTDEQMFPGQMPRPSGPYSSIPGPEGYSQTYIASQQIMPPQQQSGQMPPGPGRP